MRALPWLLLLAPLGFVPTAWRYVEQGCWDCALRQHRHKGERPQSLYLKTLASAQADFRGNDRDGDGVQQFWREDVAGLYYLRGPDGRPLALVLKELALADDAWVVTPDGPGGTSGGYWFRALRHADEDPGAPSPHRFAACAFPAEYGPRSRYVFIIDEGNTIFRGDLGRPGPPDLFPDEATLKTKWSKLD